MFNLKQKIMEMKKWIGTVCLATMVQYSWAASWSGSDITLYGVVGLCIILALTALVLVATNMMNIEAAKHGIDVTKQNFSAVPGTNDFGENVENSK
jgi:predicted RNA methylase